MLVLIVCGGEAVRGCGVGMAVGVESVVGSGGVGIGGFVVLCGFDDNRACIGEYV